MLDLKGRRLAYKRLKRKSIKDVKIKGSLKTPNRSDTAKRVPLFTACMLGVSMAVVSQQSTIASVIGSGGLGNAGATGSQVNTVANAPTPPLDPITRYQNDVMSTAYNSDSSGNNFLEIKAAEEKNAQAMTENIDSCATTGVGAVVTKNLDMQMQVWGKPIDVNKLFSPSSQGGCFADLGKIIDLSVTIPSLGSIIDAAQQMVIDYATKKACDALKTASGEIVGPVNDAIGVINGFGQYTDVSGALGTVINKELGRIDEGMVLPDSAFEPAKSNIPNSTPGFNPYGNLNPQSPQKQNEPPKTDSIVASVKGFFSNS